MQGRVATQTDADVVADLAAVTFPLACPPSVAAADIEAGIAAALTLQAAREFAAQGVRVLAIAPGLFQTPMAAEVPAEVIAAITADAIFPRRFGAPDDFADLALSMIRNPLLNGEVIRLDAGVRLRAR